MGRRNKSGDDKRVAVQAASSRSPCGVVHINSIEAFWSNVKRSIKWTYVWVSKKHSQAYLCEFEYRYNLRRESERMMDALLQAFPRA
jgi:transposase